MRIFTDPSSTFAAQRKAGITEEGNLFLIVAFAFGNFLAQLPAQYRVFSAGPQTALDADGNTVAIDFAQFAGWQAVFAIFGVALVMYALSAIAHLIAKKFGGKASWKEARRAMFLAALLSLPMVVVTSLATWAGIPNLALILSFGTLIYFLWYWGKGLNLLEYSDV